MKCACLTFLCFFLLYLELSAQTSPVPLIHQPLVPVSTSPGGAAFTLTVNGANFVAGDTVQWNRTPRVTVFVSPTKLTASISASDVATASTATVTVASPGQGATSNAVFFPITHASPFVAFAGGGVSTNNDEPSSVTTADLNNDGILELVADNVDQNSIDVLQSTGPGTFTILHRYSGVTFPVGAVIADFNGDGKPDVAVGSSNGSNLGSAAVFLGNGDLTLQSPQSFPTAPGPVEDIVGGDFNRDGKFDLAVCTGQGLSVLLGNGDGTFQAHQDYTFNTGPFSVATADFNGDGILDLAVAAESAGSVLVLIGAGDGTFAAPVNYPAVINASYVSAVDVNGDGKQDLVVIGQFDLSPLAILLGNGDGTFNLSSTQSSYAGGSPVFGDLNGDGILDVVVPGIGPTVLLGRSDGTFGMLRTYSSGGTRSVALGDFNNDGRLDAASAAFASHRIPVQVQTTAALTPGDITYPNQVIGVPSTAVPVTLTNLGWTSLTFDSVVFSGIGAANFVQTNNCPASLPSLATCTINASFAPLQKGYVQSLMQANDSALGSPQFVRLFGYGTVALLTPNKFIFGMHNVGTVSNFKTATLTNTGSTALNVSLVTLQGSGAPQFHVMSNSCTSPVPPGGSCTVNLVFAPTQTGQAVANLTFVDDGGAPTDIVQVSGTGI